MFDSVAVLGDGGWGTTIAILLSRNIERVTLWSHFPDHANQLNQTRINQKFLPGIPIPESIRILSGSALQDARPQLAVFAVPTPFVRGVATEVAAWLPDDAAVLSVSKGIETDTLLRGTQILTEVLGPRRMAVLSGPSHAEEVARDTFTLVSVASDDAPLAEAIQALFTTDTFRLYTTDDITGVELGGAIKNVMGIAAGMCDGLGYGDNTKSAVLTRALAEMTRLGAALGARNETFYGLSGVGDLITTCVSPYGRNRAAGEMIGKGKTVKEIQASTEMIAEGLLTTKALYELGKKHDVPMPITTGLYRVLYHDADPRETAQALMTRAAGPEVSD